MHSPRFNKPSQAKPSQARYKTTLKLSALSVMVAALSGCGEDAKDCGGFWDNTFGRDACAVKQPTNKIPQASFTVTLNKLNVLVDATASKDEDGSIIEYQWYVDSVAQTLSKTPPKHTMTLTEGSHHLRLVVKDNLGASQEVSQSVTVTSNGETQAVVKFKDNVFALSASDEAAVLSTQILPNAPKNSETDVYVNFTNPSVDVTERKVGDVYLIGRSEKFPLGLMAEITEAPITQDNITTFGLKYVQLPKIFDTLNASFPQSDVPSKDVAFYSVAGLQTPAAITKSAKSLLLPLPEHATFEASQCLGASVKLCVKVEQEGSNANSITAQIKGEYKPDEASGDKLEIGSMFKRKLTWLDSKAGNIGLNDTNLEADFGFKYKVEESLGVDVEAKTTTQVGGGTKKLLFNAYPLQRLFYGDDALRHMQSAGEYKLYKGGKEVVIKGVELDKDKLLLGAFVIDKRTVAGGAGGIAGFLKSGIRRGSDLHKTHVDFSVYLLMFMKLDGTITGEYHYEYSFPDETVDMGFKDSKPYYTVTDKGEPSSKHTIKADARATAGAGLDLGIMVGNIVPAQATAEGALTAAIGGVATWENNAVQGCLNHAGLYVGGRVFAETALSIEIKDAKEKGWLSFLPDYSQELKLKFPLINDVKDWQRSVPLAEFSKSGSFFCQNGNVTIQTLQEPSELSQNQWKIRADASGSNTTTIKSMEWDFGDGTVEKINENFTEHLVKEHTYTKPAAYRGLLSLPLGYIGHKYLTTLKIVYEDDSFSDGEYTKTIRESFETRCSVNYSIVAEQCVPTPKLVVEPQQLSIGQKISVLISDVFAKAKNIVWSLIDSFGKVLLEVKLGLGLPFELEMKTEGEHKIKAEYLDEGGEILGSSQASFKVWPRRIEDFKDESLDAIFEVQKIGLDTSDGTLRLPLNVGEVDSTFPYIWIANSGAGTISKLATRDHYRKNPQTGEQELVKTGQELGRYRTGPSNGNPSRTTVDQEGNVWVGNRDNNTITKVGLFEFGNCVDRNGNGKIDTSTGKDDVKDWSGYFGDGQGFANAQDECILQHVALSANGVSTPSDIRMIAIDKDNNVFAGGHYQSSIFKVNGRTGEIINAVNTNGSFYGGLIDKNGNLWAASRYYHSGRIIKVSNDLSTFELIDAGVVVYGIALDKFGKIWTTEVSSRFSAFDSANPVGTVKVFNQTGHYSAQGVAVDDNGDVFIAGSSRALVGHYKQTFVNGQFDGVEFVANYPVASSPTGVAVDGKGKVWSSNYEASSVSQITLAADPANAVINTFDVGYHPYNYSDMTGRTVRNLTNRQGTWEAIFDGATPDFEWKKLVWSLKKQLPEGTTVTAYAKAANSKVELSKDYNPVESNQTMKDKKGELIKGRFIKVKFSLTSANQESTPEITGIDLQ